MYKTTLQNVSGKRYFFHRIVKSMFPEESPTFTYKNWTLTIYSKTKPLEPFTEDIKISSCLEFTPNYSGTKIFSLVVDAKKRSRKTKKLEPVSLDRMEEWIKTKLNMFGAKISNVNISRKLHKDIVDHPKTEFSITPYEIVGVVEIEDDKLFNENFGKCIGDSAWLGYGVLEVM